MRRRRLRNIYTRSDDRKKEVNELILYIRVGLISVLVVHFKWGCR